MIMADATNENKKTNGKEVTRYVILVAVLAVITIALFFIAHSSISKNTIAAFIPTVPAPTPYTQNVTLGSTAVISDTLLNSSNVTFDYQWLEATPNSTSFTPAFNCQN